MGGCGWLLLLLLHENSHRQRPSALFYRKRTVVIRSNVILIFFPIIDGFHKITSIDNGGLRFDKDEMEFTHPCFQKDHPYLLEHIKRKIATSKQQQLQAQQQAEDKSALKLEAVSRVLSEVKNMRGRQDTLDSRFQTMKQENEALWREIAILRQKHHKQQQIVNKVRLPRRS